MKLLTQAGSEECIGGKGLGPFGNLCEILKATDKDKQAESVINVISNIVSRIVGVVTIIAGLFFLTQFFIAAFSWLTSGGDTQKVTEARQRIINALVGLVLVIASLAIMSVVSHFTGLDFLLRNPADLARQLGEGQK